MKYSVLILRNLRRNPRRTILTMVSTALSLFVFSALMSFAGRADDIVGQTASSVRIAVHNKAGLPYLMPEAYKRAISTVPYVEAVSAQTWFGGIYRSRAAQFPNLAVDPEKVEVIWPDWGISPAALREFKRARVGCLVGRSTLQRNHWVVGQRIMLHGTLYPVDVTLTVVGTLGADGPPTLLVFRRDYLDQALGRPGRLSLFWVKVDSPRHVSQVIRTIDETFANSSHETQSESEAPFFGCFLRNCQIFVRIAKLLCLLLLLAIGLVCANTAAMSVRERETEVAVMRTLGFGRALIFALLVAECVLVCIAGGMVGCGAAYAITRAVSVGIPALGFLGTIEIKSRQVVEDLVISALVGVLSGAFPAFATVRKNIADGLRACAGA